MLGNLRNTRLIRLKHEVYINLKAYVLLDILIVKQLYISILLDIVFLKRVLNGK